MSGPLPNPQKRRRNAPTIPTTQLPIEGRKGATPDPPYELGESGAKWWAWAWALPQATQWDAGALYALGRRAQLEDDMRTLDDAENFSLEDFMDVCDEDREVGARIDFVVRRLKGLAGGRVSVMREMRELDNRFGLNSKAMADLRWSMAPAEEPKATEKPAQTRRLRAVDSATG